MNGAWPSDHPIYDHSVTIFQQWNCRSYSRREHLVLARIMISLIFDITCLCMWWHTVVSFYCDFIMTAKMPIANVVCVSTRLFFFSNVVDVGGYERIWNMFVSAATIITFAIAISVELVELINERNADAGQLKFITVCRRIETFHFIKILSFVCHERNHIE